jgi:hypothetical protein
VSWMMILGSYSESSLKISVAIMRNDIFFKGLFFLSLSLSLCEIHSTTHQQKFS